MVNHERYDLEVQRLSTDVADALSHIDAAAEQGIWTPTQADNLKTSVVYFESVVIRCLRHVYFGQL